jgi:CDP-paratose 2-epimerase
MRKRIAIVTGSGGLIGSESVRRFVKDGYQVVGVDNDMRKHFFGDGASTRPSTKALLDEFTVEEFTSLSVDIRDREAVAGLFAAYGSRCDLVVHAAAQPAHDWAAKDPQTDFGVNALGTLNVLEGAREHCPEATFVHCSTSKVYGVNPNDLPLVELPTRLDLPEDHKYWYGIDTTMSIDQTTHSLFGASKCAGDLLVQEYGRYFGMNTACFRPGCLTGPQHQGAQLHGFLSYLARCALTEMPYEVIGYGGLQVRCNLHAYDLVDAFAHFHDAPRSGAVYNIGGGRVSNCSMREAIVFTEQAANTKLDWSYVETPRIGDHRWWISSNEAFMRDYPGWRVQHDTIDIIDEIVRENALRWKGR